MIASRRSKATNASNAQGGNEKMTARKTAVAAGRLRGGLSALLALLGLSALLLASPAAAKVVHVPEGGFDGSDAPGGPLSLALGAAVDNSGGAGDGDIWIADNGSFQPGTIYRFDENGAYDGVEFDGSVTPAGAFTFLDFGTFALADPLAVDSSAGANSGDLYISHTGSKSVYRFSESGAFECEITGKATPSADECAGVAGSETPTGGMTPVGAAVNPSTGHVFVIDNVSTTIYEFNEAGEYVGAVSDPEVFQPSSIDFDSVGNFYISNGNPFFGGVNVVKLDAAGNFDTTITATGEPFRVAVDRDRDRVFINSTAGVTREFDPAGNPLSSFNGGNFSLTVGDSNHRIYVDSGLGGVEIWSGPQTVPDVTTEAAAEVEETTATLHGEVDPDLANGGTEVENCEFEYGTTTAYGDSVPCAPATPYGAPQAVTGAVAGLTDSTTYHFRLKASNENGVESFGEDQVFITKGPPTVDAQSVSGITRFTANLEADVNPHGYATDVVFEYVDQAQYEVDGFDSAQATAPIDIGSAESSQPVEEEITGLSVETEYHYRAVATSSTGEDVGSDESFETVVIADVEGPWVVASIRKAKFEVDVNPLGLLTDCQAEYVVDAEFQATGFANATVLPCDPEDLGAGSSKVTAKSHVAGLEPSTTYHYRFVLENSSGTRIAEGEEFTTFGIERFDFELIGKDEEPYTQAGGHPWKLLSTVGMTSTIYRKSKNDEPNVAINALLKDVLNELPPGLIGNPEAVPKCTQKVVEAGDCSGDSMIGEVVIHYGASDSAGGVQRAFLSNIIPPKGKAARFGGLINISTDAFVDAGIRTGSDYGIDAGASQIPETVPLREIDVWMWGVPADPFNDPERRCGGEKGCASNADPKPFLRMPTECDGQPLQVGAKVNSYQEPSLLLRAKQELPAITGCNQLDFEPTIEARPTTDDSDSPTGLHVNIENPQNEDVEGLGTPDVRDVEVTLPEGLVINPASANGLEGCSEEDADLESSTPSECPNGSRVGRATVDTPLLDHPLEGSVYVAEPFDNPFDSLIALYISLDAPQSGVVIKVAGEVEADPETGQLSATFSDNPQLPFNSFEVDFFGGALAPLRTPPTCGTYSTEAEITPWSSPDSGGPAQLSDPWQIDDGPGSSGCASSVGSQPNTPAFSAGTSAPIAGAYSPFVVNLAREDGSQQFRDVTVTPPPGLVARLAGTPYCPEAGIAAAAASSGSDEQGSPSCPAASQIGAVHVSAGAGPAPYHVQGTAYLAGPYKGAPLSMAIITPATAGPFDLGTVVVRVALHVNPVTTQITAAADPIPRILEGIPLNVRTVSVRMNKPGFTLNPSSCDPTSVGGQLLSTEGALAPLMSRFQVGDCTRLDFKPRLGLRLFGKTNRGAHPKFRAVLSMAQGANITRAAIKLPRSEILDQSHIRTVCTRVQFAASACPQGSIYGFARAWSPLLAQPLQGPVYLRSSDNELPDLVADLHGQVNIAVVGRIDSVNGRIRTTFETVPDAPVSRFMLTMKGGGKGLLQNSTNVCKGNHRARAAFDAHSGAVADLRPALRNRRCVRQQRRAKRRRATKRRAAKRSQALATASKAQE